MSLICRAMIFAILGTMFLGVAAVNAQVSTDDASSGFKTFIIWVGDKNSLNLPQVKVYLDGSNYVGTTNSKGEVRTPISFGTHIISARTACGSASKEYTFSEAIDGASLYINTCPDGTESSDGSVGGTVLPRNTKIGFGSTLIGNTNWADYYKNGVRMDGIYVDVDTSSAGFTTTPVYVTSLVGDGAHYQTTGASSIYNATSTSFRVYIRWWDGTYITPEFANKWNWHIQWIGIESA